MGASFAWVRDRLTRSAVDDHAYDFGDTATPASVCRRAVASFRADAAYVARRVDDDHYVLEAREPASTLMPPGRTYTASQLPVADDAVRVPVVVAGRTRRLLLLERPGSSDDRALRRFADEAGLALEHADRLRAEEEALQNTRQTHRLLALSAALAVAHEVEEVAAALVAEGRAHTGADAATVLALDGRRLRVIAREGEPTEPPPADVLRRNQVVLVESAPADSTYAASATVPLTAGAAVVGGIELSFLETREFGAADREFLAALGRQGGLALERARLHADEVRAREEAELRAGAAQALEFVAEGVFLVDVDGVVRVWNPSAAAVTGLPARDVVGRRLADVAPWWRPVVERVPVAVAGARGAVPLTLPLETDAGELWVSISGISFDEGVVYAFRDVTDEHGLERLKSDFIATISHELRTPLAVLYGGAVTLGRDDVEVPADDRRRMLEMMVAEGRRLERLVDGILVASSLETDTARYESRLFDAAAVVRDVVAELNATTSAAVDLTIGADAGDRAVLGDRDHLRQIVANLVENAVKYSPGETGVQVSVVTAGEQLRIGVADDGLGVAHADRERIFDKFFRADSQLTNGVRGTGLGLYIVRELVQRMNGQVWVEPRPERGSLFVVELPTQPATFPEVDPS